jgi:cation-transporting ATPase E
MTDLPTKLTGLTTAQATERAARGEVNQFEVRIGRTNWEIFRDNVFNIFNLVLASLGVVMIIFQDYVNLLFASFSVVLNSIVGLVQEFAAKRALEKLAALSIQRVKVYRDGNLVELPINQLVKDDILPLEPGEKIVVDGKVLHSDALEMNESQLTGESDAIFKERGDKVFSGSFVVAGSGVMQVTEVGANSTINKLAATAKAYRRPVTPTQRQINTLVELMVVLMVIFSPMTVIAGVVTGQPTIEIVRNAVVLVTSMVPQGLVLVTTISLSIGALIISRSRTLVQRVNAVESMANVDVLCFDKTGTLTKNELSVTSVIPLNGMSVETLHIELRRYVENLANQNRTAGAIGKFVGAQANTPQTKIKEIPFTSGRKWGAIMFPPYTLILGAPERVLHPQRDAQAISHARQLAAEGQRVLAFARTNAPFENALPDDREALALIVMADQMRPEINSTIKAFADQNVELKVISGDNLETVRSIAYASGMRQTSAYTGDQLEKMDEAAFASAVSEANIFARIEPETKRRIIRTLKGQGHYVAMVGDGVNDVPALKEANMAVAMNDGAQIAKDVADLVLLDNAMTTLPNAFERGKVITQKIFGTTRLFLVKNLYTVLAFIFIGFMALPFPTTPILISWLTFGMVNVPGGLVTFGLLRPAYVPSFGRVVRYVAAAMIVGALSTAILYATLYLLTAGLTPTPDLAVLARDTARSGVFVFMALYGLLVFWDTMGLDLMQPHTLQAKPRIALLGVILVLLTLIPPYLLPDVFMGFVNPSVGTFGLAILAALIGGVTLRLVFNNRRLQELEG